MTRREPIAEIINGPQSRLLAMMADAPGRLCMQDLIKGSGLTRSYCTRLLMEMREVELADVATAGELGLPRPTANGRTALMYTATRAGLRALTRYTRKADANRINVVAPPTFNTRDQPYVPTRQAYYRNEGNRHIASRGFSC